MTTSSDHAPTTSLSLLQLVGNNDPVAWRRLVELYGGVVYGWARGFRLQNDDSADVMQEVFQVVHRSLPRYCPDAGGTFRGWLWTITLNKTRDLIRARDKRPQVPGGEEIQRRLLELPEPVEDEFFPDAVVSQGQFLIRAANLIREDFDPKSWTCFERLVIDGHSPLDVAEDLQMSPGAVRQAKYRVLRHLRIFFKDFL
ncbi:MAG: sigma-70 family polymerase sigma factor [Planctomycetaceae bacterium]|nr:sigma-70 family polymerase sigma factor [Planctomycetaceae bacterium]